MALLISKSCRAALLLALLGVPLSAFADATKEYQIKAAFLYNFIKFTEWPETSFSDSGSIVIGAYCDEDFEAELSAIVKGRSVNGRGVSARRLVAPVDARFVHVAFVCAAQDAQLAQVRDATRNLPVLLVGESGLAAGQGATVNFVRVEDKVRFQINAGVAERAGMKISAQLQKLALPRSTP